jgi:DNA-binding NtrC family response regulator
LFLDEVAEMPLAVQAKLLRVLEMGELSRLGSVEVRHVDVRIVSASNQDLDVLVGLGKMRDDFVSRLNGVTIDVPPLRERTEEIVGLAEAFLREAAAGKRLSDEALALLRVYRFPGNVLELKNIVHRSAVLTPGEVVHIENLEFGRTGAVSLPPPLVPPPAVAVSVPAPAITDDERSRILKALEHCGGNQTEAAKQLGMTRRMLVYRLSNHRIRGRGGR